MAEQKKNNGVNRILYLLKHHPEAGGLTLDDRGWCEVNDLLNSLEITKQDLDFIMVENEDKLAYNEEQTRIRATHGHSVPINYEPDLQTELPEAFFVSESKLRYHEIQSVGIQLEEGYNELKIWDDFEKCEEENKHKAFMRNIHGLVTYTLNKEAMLANGYNFYKSTDGTWFVTKSIAPKYLIRVFRVEDDVAEESEN